MAAKSPRILSTPYGFDHHAVEGVEFGSERSWLDADIVIWDPTYAAGEYTKSNWRGRPSMPESMSPKFEQDLDRRKTEMAEMVQLGRTLVVTLTSSQVVWVDTGKREYSGTGRGRVTTRILRDIDVLSALPIEPPRAVAAHGVNISGMTDAAKDFVSRVGQFISYFAYFDAELATQLFGLTGTTKCVGAAFPAGKGTVIFVPDFDPTRIPEDEVASASGVYVDAILDLIDSARYSESSELPAWADEVILPDESRVQGEVTAIETELAATLARRDRAQVALAEAQRRKLLFTGTGQPLVDEVRRSFELLGCSFEEAEPGRDDLILRHGERVAVVEVKGVRKSGAESHAAQLEKWVSAYIERTGHTPKGILEVNAFKDAAVAKRTGRAFPDQMLEYSTRRQHCLVTGLQLLTALVQVEAGRLDAASLLDLLFATEGRVPGLDIADSLDTRTQRQSSAPKRRRSTGGSAEVR